MQMSSSEWEKEKKKHDEEQIAEIFFLAVHIIWETDEFILLRRMETKEEFPSKLILLAYKYCL